MVQTPAQIHFPYIHMVIVGHPAVWEKPRLSLGDVAASNMDVRDTFAGKSAFNLSIDSQNSHGNPAKDVSARINTNVCEVMTPTYTNYIPAF